MNTTILDIVQLALSDIGSDEVNSIGDTIEATDIANIVRYKYKDIVDELDLQNVKQLFQLDGLGDTSRPAIMRVPSGVHAIEWIKYNCKRATDDTDNWTNILQLDPSDFMDHTTQRNADGIDMLVANGVSIRIRDDAPPGYWTTFDGTDIVFDSYDSGVDSTMNSSKTNCFGQGSPTLVMDDTTPINLPPRFISLLINEVRKTAFDLKRDGIPISVMQDSSQSRVRIQRTKHVDRMNRERNDLPDYGRKRR